ncbi:YkoF family thiamine/hydroxymethylpyrimidine-binding protein [Microlunatus flavus]|uniref:YKOF-related Family n=1 Tax=Microlunatus flavus TaxID=1036181 RepID=A0A1H9A4Y8_9ACTN|nr:YkoF family thiamine/hydroxymethylpyrimidine-binding protein [Microlunatus flavus]SEP71591.1 YKOF-related Family [Microlunatus flavus]
MPSTTTPTLLPADDPRALVDDPLAFGVGARVTLAVMADRYVELITDALASADAGGLVLETGDVSTYAGGTEHDLLRWLTQLGAAVAASGVHAAMVVHLSRGCPGEVVCALPGGAGPRAVETPGGVRTGHFATAEWALYPLADEVTGDVEPDHMRDIYTAIARARDNGTFVASEHFVTRLAGDLGDVLGTVVAGWTGVGRSVQHVTSHLTVSLNSPSHTAGEVR